VGKIAKFSEASFKKNRALDKKINGKNLTFKVGRVNNNEWQYDHKKKCNHKNKITASHDLRGA